MTHRVIQALRLAALAGAASLLFASCDNPACVYSGNCGSGGGGGGGGGVGTEASVLPSTNLWLNPAEPTVESFFPTGTQIATTTPIAIVFSESMAQSTLASAFQIAIAGTGQGIPVSATLSADGRVAVLIPTVALQADTDYEVGWRDNALITDLQGSKLARPSDGIVGTFSTAATDPTAPRIVMTFPPDNATGQGLSPEVLVLFDRPVNVTAPSWVVRVGNNPPAENPAPTALTISAGQASIEDRRGWRWRSANPAGVPAELQINSVVSVQLSPSTAPITAVGGTTSVADTTFDFTLAPFGTPRSIDVLSLPFDAIGKANLDGLDPSAALEMELWLYGSDTADLLDLYVIGTGTGTPAKLITLFREVELGTLASYDPLPLNHDTGETVKIGEGELDLASATAPLALRLAEGSVFLAASLRRGSVRSPAFVLDTDLDASGSQGLLLDVTPPEFTGFGTSGTNTTTFSSDQADLVVVGRANEQIRSVEVVSGASDNGFRPDVVASRADGLFIAAPVALGLVDPALGVPQLEMVLYDRAYNPAVSTVFASFLQTGAVGPGLAVPGAATQFQVSVHDARTNAPIAGARVIVHDFNLGTSTLVDFDTTDVQGFAIVDAALASESIVTVEATGYDLWSFHGARVSSLRVPLSATNLLPGVGAGTVSNSSAFTSFERAVSDSRRLEGAAPTSTVSGCTTVGSISACQYGPLTLRPGPLGALSFFATVTPASAFTFSATSFLRSFAIELPIPPATPGSPSAASISTTVLLDDASVDTEDRVLEGPAAVLDASTALGLLLSNPDGAPRITVEGNVPGIAGAVVVGRGAALDAIGSPAAQWAVRSAIPGAVDPTANKYQGDVRGDLITSGTVENALYFRAEIRDTLGGRSGLRPRFNAVPNVLNLPQLPLITSPLPLQTTAGPSYDVQFVDVLAGPDPGLYRVTLVGASGRRWVLWREDFGGAFNSVHLPDLSGAGGTPLPSGTVLASVSAYAYPTLDAAAFAFAELEKRTTVISESAPLGFTQP